MKGSDKLWSGVLILIFILEIMSVYKYWNCIVSLPDKGIIIVIIIFEHLFILGAILSNICDVNNTLWDDFEIYKKSSLPIQLFPFVFLWGSCYSYCSHTFTYYFY